MLNKPLLIILLSLFISTSLTAQRMLKISVSIDGKEEHLSYISRKGVSYISAIDLCKILGAGSYYNVDANKVDMKFRDFNLKVTGRNQFFVLTSRTNNSQQVYQIPISTLLMRDDVFMPIQYSLKYIMMAYGQEIIFNEKDKHLTVTGKRFNPAIDFVKSDVTKVDNSDEDSPITFTPTKRPSKNIDSPYDIYGISIDEKSNGTLIRLKSQKTINRFSSSITDGKLRLFLSDVKVDPGLSNNIRSTGFIKNATQKNIKGNIQLEFLLKEGYSTHESIKDLESDDILITIHSKVFETAATDVTKDKEDWNFDVIVIDAGHGGKDPGAIGVTGVKEKDVNLSVGLELGKIIKYELPGVKVVYTRDDDRFVELYKRGKIANENNGKLFISIHANSIAKKGSSTRGFEVYLLRPGRTKKAIEIAEFENSVIDLEDNPDRYQKLTDENFILVSMAHSAYMRYSEKFSDILNKKWIDKVRQIPSRGVKQAGFYVLVGASMPGVLIETGFLSNRKDEKYLNSSRGQKEIARAIFEAVKEYKAHYDAELDAES
jgi:N-acetylmuramoyl-L-alanine amidase